MNFKWEDKEIVYFLKTGAIKIVFPSTNHTKYTIKKGNVFGELALLDSEDNNEDKAIAFKDGAVCFIEASQIRFLMKKHSLLKNSILKLNGLKIKKLERKLEDIIYKDSKTRIKEYIFDSIAEFGIKKENILEAENLLSHTEIANLTNTSRQTVNNVMSQLRKDH
jgi:CRP/FNR family transcriptional regulator